MEAIPKVGAGPIRFGMTRGMVRALLGKPDEREREVDSEGDEDERWTYHQHELEVTFQSNEDWRVGSLTLEAPEINGVDPVGMFEEEALEALRRAGVPSLILDDGLDEIGMRDYACPELDMYLWLEDGVVTSVSLFCEYDESDTHPAWPDPIQESAVAQLPEAASEVERKPANPRCSYLRFALSEVDGESHRKRGVLVSAHDLSESGQLANVDQARVESLLNWFNTHLKVPSLLRGNEHRRAISWYKSTAETPIGMMWELVHLLRDNGCLVELLKTKDPGSVIYEDKWQVVAKPPRGRRRPW